MASETVSVVSQVRSLHITNIHCIEMHRPVGDCRNLGVYSCVLFFRTLDTGLKTQYGLFLVKCLFVNIISKILTVRAGFEPAPTTNRVSAHSQLSYGTTYGFTRPVEIFLYDVFLFDLKGPWRCLQQTEARKKNQSNISLSTIAEISQKMIFGFQIDLILQFLSGN